MTITFQLYFKVYFLNVARWAIEIFPAKEHEKYETLSRESLSREYVSSYKYYAIDLKNDKFYCLVHGIKFHNKYHCNCA